MENENKIFWKIEDINYNINDLIIEVKKMNEYLESMEAMLQNLYDVQSEMLEMLKEEWVNARKHAIHTPGRRRRVDMAILRGAGSPRVAGEEEQQDYGWLT